jgi:hypothetical protein
MASFSNLLRLVFNWISVAQLLGQGGHVHGLDLPEGGELLQPLPGLLLHGNYKGVLHVAVLRQFLR